MEPFNHGFTPDSLKNPQGFEVIGYNKAMGQVLEYLKEVTQFKPANRLIDSVPLIEKIGATFVELSKLHKDLEDEVATTILSATKSDQNERS